jgi:hypothetical protein
MSCTYKTASSPTFNSAAAEMGRSGFLIAIIATFDAFREALKMRRIAHRRFFLGDE